MTVFYILVPVFILVGLWLVYYNSKKSGVMRKFAARRGMSYSKKSPGLDDELDRVFGLKMPFARAFMLVKDVVTDGPVRLMRMTELIDLHPHGTPKNTHYARLAAYLPAAEGPDLILGFGHGGTGGYDVPRVMYPLDADISKDERVGRLMELLKAAPPPHPLTVTLMHKKALIYLEPLVAGSEGAAEANYLLNLAMKFK